MLSIQAKRNHKLCTNGINDDPDWNVCGIEGCSRKTRNKTGKACHYHMNKASELKDPEYYRLIKSVANDRWIARGRKPKDAY